MDENTEAGVAAPLEIAGLEFIRPIGRGGTSEVWLARQVPLGREVAVKILDASRLADDAERARFLAEAQVAVRIASPSVVQILDFGEAAGRLYYVMEYASGGSLADWLRENPHMPPRTVFAVVKGIAATLGQAWKQAQLVHGDIKPGNILLGADGSIKLTDLGLASLADARGTRSPETDSVEGTPTYFAPEQLEGTPPSPQSDMYALGLTAYHLLTGRPPFDGLLTAEAVLEAQRSDYLPDPIPLAPGLSVHGAWLLQKLTAKDPSGRPRDWQDVVSDTDLVLADRAPSPPYPAPDETTILLEHSHLPTARDNAKPRQVAGKRVIRMTPAGGGVSSASASSPYRPAPRPQGMSGAAKFLIFLLVLLGGLAALWFFVLKDKMGGHEPAPVEKPAAPPPEPTRTVPEEKPAETASGTSYIVTPYGAWTHPRYVELGNRFNEILAGYRDAAGLAEDFTRPENSSPAEPDDPRWPGIASEAEDIARGLDALIPEAPEGFPLQELANMAWQLAKDARLAQRTPADKRADFRRAPKHRHEDFAPWPTPSPEDPSSPFAARFAQLGYAWDTLPAPADEASAELLLLLTPHATPSPAMRFQPDQKIFGTLVALMDVAEAAKTVGADLPARHPLGPSFPVGGMFRHDIPAGRYGNLRRPPYPKLSLIADSEGRLLGLYFLDDAPEALKNSEGDFSPNTRTGDFLEGTVLPPGGTQRACHQVFTLADVIRIDSEIADFSETPPRPVRQSSLLLPSATANALLYHLFGRND